MASMVYRRNSCASSWFPKRKCRAISGGRRERCKRILTVGGHFHRSKHHVRVPCDWKTGSLQRTSVHISLTLSQLSCSPVSQFQTQPSHLAKSLTILPSSAQRKPPFSETLSTRMHTNYHAGVCTIMWDLPYIRIPETSSMAFLLLPPTTEPLLGRQILNQNPFLLFRSLMKETGLMALPLLAKAWTMWFCMTHSMQKLPW